MKYVVGRVATTEEVGERRRYLEWRQERSAGGLALSVCVAIAGWIETGSQNPWLVSEGLHNSSWPLGVASMATLAVLGYSLDHWEQGVRADETRQMLGEASTPAPGMSRRVTGRVLRWAADRMAPERQALQPQTAAPAPSDPTEFSMSEVAKITPPAPDYDCNPWGMSTQASSVA